jgi:hypothetical protein
MMIKKVWNAKQAPGFVNKESGIKINTQAKEFSIEA